MRKLISEKIAVPEGVQCSYESGMLKVQKSGNSVSKSISAPGMNVAISGNEITLSVKKGSKREFNVVKSYVAHIGNMFSGLAKEYIYNLEACNVHFPMTMKVDKDKLVISNFLGEKVSRSAKILPNVKVDIKAPKITLTGRDKEAVGQTAANIEKATKIRNRDRRIFQDGIFLVSKEVAA